MPPSCGADAHTHTRPFSSGPPWGRARVGGRAFAQPPCPRPCTLTQAGSSTWPSQLCGRELGSWSQGLSLVTSPQDPAALTETSISHRPRVGIWLGSHSSSRGSGCSPAAKCPCPSPSPQAGVSVRVCSCGASVSYCKCKQIKEDSLRLVLLRPRVRGHGVGEPELVPHRGLLGGTLRAWN